MKQAVKQAVLEGDMTGRQAWALFCITGLDVRGLPLTKQDASGAIDALNNGSESEKQDATEFLLGMGAKKTGGKRKGKSLNDQRNGDASESFEELYRRAYAAGVKAAGEATGADMCGFGWVNVKPGTSRFARWLKKQGYARRDSYQGGVTIWISEHGQSQLRKWRHAQAMAFVLKEAGHDAMDYTRSD